MGIKNAQLVWVVPLYWTRSPSILNSILKCSPVHTFLGVIHIKMNLLKKCSFEMIHSCAAHKAHTVLWMRKGLGGRGGLLLLLHLPLESARRAACGVPMSRERVGGGEDSLWMYNYLHRAICSLHAFLFKKVVKKLKNLNYKEDSISFAFCMQN